MPFIIGRLNITRPVQPVATCRQPPYVHKPAIFKLLLLIYKFLIQVCFPCNDHAQPATPTSVTRTFLNSSVVLIVVWITHYLCVCVAMLTVGEEKRYVCYSCNSTINSGCGPVFNESSVRQIWCETGQVCLKTTTRLVNGQKKMLFRVRLTLGHRGLCCKSQSPK